MQNQMLEWAQALEDGTLSLRKFLKQIAVDANVCVDMKDYDKVTFDGADIFLIGEQPERKMKRIFLADERKTLRILVADAITASCYELLSQAYADASSRLEQESTTEASTNWNFTQFMRLDSMFHGYAMCAENSLLRPVEKMHSELLAHNLECMLDGSPHQYLRFEQAENSPYELLPLSLDVYQHGIAFGWGTQGRPLTLWHEGLMIQCRSDNKKLMRAIAQSIAGYLRVCCIAEEPDEQIQLVRELMSRGLNGPSLSIFCLRHSLYTADASMLCDYVQSCNIAIENPFSKKTSKFRSGEPGVNQIPPSQRNPCGEIGPLASPIATSQNLSE